MNTKYPITYYRTLHSNIFKLILGNVDNLRSYGITLHSNIFKLIRNANLTIT